MLLASRLVTRLPTAVDLRKAQSELFVQLGVDLKKTPQKTPKKERENMARHDEREYLRQVFMEAAREELRGMPVLVPVHLAGCQAIADCFMVNRGTVRQWMKAGAPIALIGGRLSCEYNMLMHWLVRR